MISNKFASSQTSAPNFKSFFSITRTIFSQSRSQQFWKQNTILAFSDLFFLSVAGEIAALVEEKRAADQADGSSSIAGTLDGFVRRKVIKQTVMTTVYGVTGYGAKLQIAKQLKDIDEFPQDKVTEGKYILV